VGLILDLAVIAIAAVVVISLALLTWTLGVSSVRSVRDARRDVAAARQVVAKAEARIVALARRDPGPGRVGLETDGHGEQTER
jgi:hypothetical protein